MSSAGSSNPGLTTSNQFNACAAADASAIPEKGSEGTLPMEVSEPGNGEGLTEEERKRAQRMQRNRESALLSRQRKKTLLDDLDRRNKELESQNAQLNGGNFI
jgi:bZIP transcription factor